MFLNGRFPGEPGLDGLSPQFLLPLVPEQNVSKQVAHVFMRLMPFLHSLSEKSFGSHIPDTLPMLLSGRLSAALQFPVSLKQDGSVSLATWHVQITGKIINKPSVHLSIHQETGEGL